MVYKLMVSRIICAIPFLLSLLSTNAYSFDELTCGVLDNHFGPFDYRERSKRPADLEIVEIRHFTHGIQTLTRKSTGPFEQDLHYTLRVWPNHHRALYTMMKQMLKNPWNGSDKYYPLHCYFERAVEFAKTDGVVYHLFGLYLHKTKKYEESISMYEKAAKYEPKSAEMHYNFGLVLFDTKRYLKSKKHAQLASELGYPYKGLLEKLSKIKLP